MIRRNAMGTNDQARWILISQVDHAQVSGRLAAAWQGIDLLAGAERDEMIFAVDHHDDGWAAWEQNLRVDARTGRPRQFTEMQLTDSLNIWTQSIESAAEAGPLAGYAVAGHFIYLMRTASAWCEPDTTDALLARHWVADFESRQTKWLAARQSTGQVTQAYEMGQTAVATLQLFDVLSLWLCCAERTTAAEFSLPNESTVTLTPESGDRINIDPWPFAEAQFELSVPGRSIPARAYQNAADLADTESEAVTLAWRLTKPEKLPSDGVKAQCGPEG
jgi:hypothetical protein